MEKIDAWTDCMSWDARPKSMQEGLCILAEWGRIMPCTKERAVSALLELKARRQEEREEKHGR